MHVQANKRVDVEELEVGQYLAEGAFGKIYKGKYRGAEVAIKELHSGRLDPETLKGTMAVRNTAEFMAEVHIMSAITHPNLLALVGFTLQPPRMILEFASGGDLHTLFNPHRLASKGCFSNC